MATLVVMKLILLMSLFEISVSAGKVVEEQRQLLRYHGGPLLSGEINVNLIWYGHFKPSQRAIVSDFISSLRPTSAATTTPTVAAWWRTTEKYYHHHLSSTKPSSLPLSLSLNHQIVDQTYSLGKSLTSDQIADLATRGQPNDAVNVVLTSSDVAVEGFCTSRCGTHHYTNYVSRSTYIWVGNAEGQCLGRCAWPFQRPVYGPQGEPLVAPNADVGVDGMVINLAELLAGTATNPFGDGYFQGAAEAPLEAATACPGVYGRGAYPGYAGRLLVDVATRASYNAVGVNGRRFLLPALYDPSTCSCSTLT